MLYFSKIQDDSHRIIAPISCIMPSFHKLNLTDIIGCVHVRVHVVIAATKRENHRSFDITVKLRAIEFAESRSKEAAAIIDTKYTWM